MNLISEETTDCACAICGGEHNCSSCNLYETVNHVPDNKVLSKARLTLPKIFKIETLVDGTNTIFCKEAVTKGTLFGPLEANRIFSLNPDIVFPLKIFTTDEDDYFGEYYLNNFNEKDCNWMMFIAPAQNFDEQNLICFQDKEQIYYLSIKDIGVGQELKVWYSPFYAKKINKCLLEPKEVQGFEENASVLDSLDISSIVKKQPNVQERETWTCKFCSVMFTDVVSFAKHISEHYAMQLRNQCQYCNSTFKVYRSLQKHIKIMHTSVSLTSHKDNEKTGAKDINKQNEQSRKEGIVGGPLLNDILSDSMDNTNILLSQSGFDISLENENIYMETDNLNVDNLLSENVKELDHFNFEIGENQEQFICDICLKEFSKLKYLYLHLNKHTGKYNCKICKKIFSTKENLMGHECNAINTYECTICLKKFQLKKYLLRHMRCYHAEFACEICNKTYQSAIMLKQHVCIGGGPEKSLKCEICGKMFSKSSYLRKHMKLHLEEKKKKKDVEESEKIICEVCSRQFSHMSNYTFHMKTHSDPQFSCDLCDKKFYKKYTLDNHLTTHQDTEFKCNICDKVLKTKKYLIHHMKGHTIETSVKCSECPKLFTFKSSLKKHQEFMHKKKCNACDETFKTHEEFLQHKSKHLDSFYCCPVCKHNVKLRSSLRRHLKKLHPEYEIGEGKISECKVMNSVNEAVKMIVEEEDEDVQDIQIQNSTGDEEVISNEIKINSIEIKAVTHKEQEAIHLDDDNKYNDKTDTITIQQNITTNQAQSQDYNVDDFDDLDLKFEDEDGQFHKTNEEFQNQSDLGIPITSNLEETENILDFNNLEMEFNREFNATTQAELSTNSVCVSMPEIMQNVTLGENAYVLENGTIIEPQDQGNVVVYILDRKFDTESTIASSKNDLV